MTSLMETLRNYAAHGRNLVRSTQNQGCTIEMNLSEENCLIQNPCWSSLKMAWKEQRYFLEDV